MLGIGHMLLKVHMPFISFVQCSLNCFDCATCLRVLVYHKGMIGCNVWGIHVSTTVFHVWGILVSTIGFHIWGIHVSTIVFHVWIIHVSTITCMMSFNSTHYNTYQAEINPTEYESRCRQM